MPILPIHWYALRRFVGLALMAFTVNFNASAVTRDQANTALNICISSAAATFEQFEFKRPILTRHCKCVERQLSGNLPGLATAWESTGNDSPAFSLVNCAKNDITAYFSKTALNTAKNRLLKNGYSADAVERFGTCAGEGAFAQIRRAAANPNESSPGLDKASFRAMYATCESDAK